MHCPWLPAPRISLNRPVDTVLNTPTKLSRVLRFVRAVREPPPCVSSYLPVPVSATVCGLLLALSTTFRVAVRAPFAVGEKVTEIVQDGICRDTPLQVSDSEKSPG